MNPLLFLVFKALLSGLVIAVVSELAQRHKTVASVVHSLPLVSLLAFIWLYLETRDTALIGRHAAGTFWFVLPTLPFFLLLPLLFRQGWAFWPALGAGVIVTALLYASTLWLTRALHLLA